MPTFPHPYGWRDPRKDRRNLRIASIKAHLGKPRAAKPRVLAFLLVEVERKNTKDSRQGAKRKPDPSRKRWTHMRTQFSILLLSTVSLLAVMTPPSLAVNMVDYYQEWILTPDSAQGHPRKHTIAFLVTESFPLTACEFRYTIDRQFDGVAPQLEPRGKIKATLKIVRRNKTLLKIGTRKIKIEETWEYGGRAFLMWADASGADWYGDSVNTNLLPFDLEPGDVILWTFKFSGVKDLAFETTDGMTMYDVIHLRAGYYNCGTFEHPCL